MNLYLLYIDPGTGSALFSILLAVAAALYFFLRALILKLKVVFSGRKKTVKNYQGETRYPYVIYNEGKQYCNVFKPVVEQFEKNKKPLLYLTSFLDDFILKSSWNYVKAEYIGEGNKAFAYLNFLSADFVLMTTPGLNVYQLKRSKMVKHYSHILHSVTDSTRYRMFALDYFDSVLLTGDYHGRDIRFLEKLRSLPEKVLFTVGCTYLDVFAEKIKNIRQEENQPFTVLISPSWGVSALLSRYGEKLLEPLAASNWRIIIRPHPQSKISEASMLENIEARYKNCSNIIWDYETDNIYSLAKADIMISDFSGIIFDFMFLRDKPVLYVNYDFDPTPYDADDLDHELWQFKAIKEAGIEIKENDLPNIIEIIKNCNDNESLTMARKTARQTAWQNIGEAGERTYNFMIETVEGNLK